MNEIVENIMKCNSFDETTLQLRDKHNCNIARQHYPTNYKIVLSSTLLAKFPDELGASAELSQHASELVQRLKENVIISSEDPFFLHFETWKCRDAEILTTEIEQGIEMLKTLKTKDVENEADQQWNDGIDHNVQTMQQCLTKLSMYGSPT